MQENCRRLLVPFRPIWGSSVQCTQIHTVKWYKLYTPWYKLYKDLDNYRYGRATHIDTGVIPATFFVTLTYAVNS